METKDNLDSYVQNMQKEENENYGSDYRFKDGLISETHNPVNCSICGKTMPQGSLWKHVQVSHEGMCKIECEICGGRYWKEDKERHERTLFHINVQARVNYLIENILFPTRIEKEDLFRFSKNEEISDDENDKYFRI